MRGMRRRLNRIVEEAGTGSCNANEADEKTVARLFIKVGGVSKINAPVYHAMSFVSASYGCRVAVTVGVVGTRPTMPQYSDTGRDTDNRDTSTHSEPGLW